MAGGSGTRLYPLTKAISKHMLPVYDKPMIYYPLSTLMSLNIKDILIITTKQDIAMYKKLLSDGSQIGISISYAIQQNPRGIADAFIVGKDFIGKDSVALILGDNIFYRENLSEIFLKALSNNKGATIFGYQVKDPENYGIVELGSNKEIISIEEKPNPSKSNYAIVGLYFYDNQVINIATNIKPSPRGELEITDIINQYRENDNLEVELLNSNIKWMDTGTCQGLLDASKFVEIIQKEKEIYIASIEEIAYRKGYITKEQLIKIAKPMINTEYGKYLNSLVR